MSFKNGEILINNEYVKNYICDKHNTNLNIIDKSNYNNLLNDIKNNIIQYIDDIGKGIVYLDFNSNMINEIIGDIDDYNFLNIYGYDEINQRPIILGINKDYESGGI
jgi:hypothetical protein